LRFISGINQYGKSLNLLPAAFLFQAFILLAVPEMICTVKPQFVQSLLEQCRSVKVKRLFLYLAEKAGHDWVKLYKRVSEFQDTVPLHQGSLLQVQFQRFLLFVHLSLGMLLRNQNLA
jgi:hypothetical protein